MKDRPEASAPVAHFVSERVMAPILGVSVSFLQKDRRGPRRIPFVQLGDKCLYDPAEALAAVKALSVGGPRGTRRRHPAYPVRDFE